MSEEKVKREKFRDFNIVIAHDESDIILTAEKDDEVVAKAVIFQTGPAKCWLNSISESRSVRVVDKFGDAEHNKTNVIKNKGPLVVTWIIKRAVEEAKARGWTQVEYGHAKTGTRAGRGRRVFGTKKKKVKRKPL